MIPLILFILFIALSGVFSGTEMAYISRDRVSHMARLRGKTGVFYGTMPREVIATILLGNNLVIVGATVSATHLFLGFTGRAESASLATILSTLTILILGEIIPKAVARAQPDAFMRVFGAFVWWSWRITRPFVGFLLRIIRVDVSVSPKAEVREFILRMRQEGRITEKEAKIAIRGLSLSEMSISELCDRDFRIVADEAEVKALLSSNPGTIPVLVKEGEFFAVDAKLVFLGKKTPLVRLRRMSESARVSSAIEHLRKEVAIAVVDRENNLIGLLTPQSLLRGITS
ncbi:MAG: DUF21 domain-containing protein [candidate division WOR-3 bacterium]